MSLARSRGALAALAAACLAAASARATTVVPLDVEGLTDLADVVVAGTVASVRVEQDAEIGLLVTRIDVAVERTLKGAPRATARILQVGGRLGDREIVVPGAPRFEEGERVLLFGNARKGELLVTGLFQGKWRIETRGDGGTVAIQDPAERGVHVLDVPAPTDALPVPRVESFEDVVRRVLARAARETTP